MNTSENSQVKSNEKTPFFLKDYQAPAYLIKKVALDVNIEESGVIVKSRLDCVRNTHTPVNAPIVLDGEDLQTLSVSLNGKVLSDKDYQIDQNQLQIPGVSETFTLEISVCIHPDKNTQLSGFYQSKDGFFTQCEPQGFRRITWFIDRPDVMATYTVTLHADKGRFPHLLANGNPVASGEEAGGRHFATWEDPFVKPSYLFAMVAAKLDVLKDTYQTKSGRTVHLSVFVEPGKLDQSDYAMLALKKSMRWDEETFGLECDLEHYMIVAVGDFNMGAMENKGLNIFNTKYVLARKDVATDVDFENIDRVVSHEYFHNWTGNRVTCRDWFQLSLKEGLTVFRDQEFGADMHSRNVARIREVRGLRAMQFPEDAGPMAHPVRPASYLEINNFYTMTVYEKGAEVVRMIHTLIGKDAFRQGMEIYFERHDGQAVTCDDFVLSMQSAYHEKTGNNPAIDFTQFMHWYSQSGTPCVKAATSYDKEKKEYTLSLTQSCPATLGQDEKESFLIPFKLGLLDETGQDIYLGNGEKTKLLQLTKEQQSFIFKNIPSEPIPSLLRDFSAPVIVDYDYSDQALCHLLAHDSDSFNRWEAGQRLFGKLILENTQKHIKGLSYQWPAMLGDAARNVLCSGSDPAFIAEALILPTESTLAEQMEIVDPEALFLVRTDLAKYLAQTLEKDFAKLYAALQNKQGYSLDKESVAARRLRNLCLAYLAELDQETYLEAAFLQFKNADNMTDQFAALSILANTTGKRSDEALEAFYKQWSNEALVVDKWLSVQASSRISQTLSRIEKLINHPAFDRTNPNKVYALIRAFGANHRHFHAKDGSGYAFMARQIALLDPINPQVASRLARSFDRWRKFDEIHQQHARKALETLHTIKGLSNDVFEIIEKALA